MVPDFAFTGAVGTTLAAIPYHSPYGSGRTVRGELTWKVKVVN